MEDLVRPSDEQRALAAEKGWTIPGWDAERPSNVVRQMMLERSPQGPFIHMPIEIDLRHMERRLNEANWKLVQDQADG